MRLRFAGVFCCGKSQKNIKNSKNNRKNDVFSGVRCICFLLGDIL